MRRFIKTLSIAAALASAPLTAAPNQILGWNNLGMHCMDSDCSVFSILRKHDEVRFLQAPAMYANDNLRNQAIQGHAGTTMECIACHTTSAPTNLAGGPHGLHPVGKTVFAEKRDHQEQWFHGEAKEGVGPGLASCRACHGPDYRGTELSRIPAASVLLSLHRTMIREWTCTGTPRLVTTRTTSANSWTRGY